MSQEELNKLMEHIQKYHNPLKVFPRSQLKAVKYVHPNYDNRTGEWFSITIRTTDMDEVLFHTQNECSDLKESLFERVMAYLHLPGTWVGKS